MDSDRPGSALPVSSAVVLAVVVAGIALYESPLVSERPGAASQYELRTTRAEDAYARLWQDPFARAIEHRRSASEGEEFGIFSEEALTGKHRELHTWENLAGEIDRVRRSGALVPMPVLTRVGPTAEDAENRLRQRIAVVAGLTAQGFSAKSPDRIGYINAGWNEFGCWLSSPPDDEGLGRADDKGLVPFEWFEWNPMLALTQEGGTTAKPPVETILVLWLPEDEIVSARGNLLLPIDDLLRHLAGGVKTPWVDSPDSYGVGSPGKEGINDFQVAVLGPTSSRGLHQMTRRFTPCLGDAPLGESSGVVALLISRVHSYLDYGIPAGSRLPLEKAIDQKFGDRIERILEREEPIGSFQTDLSEFLESNLPTVEDSDTDWAQTTVAVWTEEVLRRARRPPSYHQFVEEVAAELLSIVDIYLDEGIPEEVSGAALEKSLEGLLRGPLRGVIASGEPVEDLRAALAAELRASIDVDDFDSGWAENSVDNWYASLPQGSVTEKLPASLLPNTRIYSGRATAADAFFRDSIESLQEACDEPQLAIDDRVERQTNATLVTTTPRDDQLAVLLVEELERRGFDEGSEKLVLVGESDTRYGQALLLSVECELDRSVGRRSDAIVHVSYLRGVDGVTVDSRTATGTMKQGKQRSDIALKLPDGWGRGDAAPMNPLDRLSRAAKVDEPAVGPGRFDHMRRLAIELKRRDRWSHHRFGERKVGAIGVLGHDVYDKQIVLQALKPRFPNAVFFTTDLDARFLESDASKWSRNLVVASGFGLQLDADLQRGVSPFRDSYQTATFFSVLEALNDPVLKKKQGDGTKLQPRLFEVARSGVIDITPKSLANGIHPDPYDRFPGWVAVAALIPLLAASVLLLSVLVPGVHIYLFDRSRLEPTDRIVAHWMVGGTLVALVALAIAIRVSNHTGEGEPLAVWSGVSIWPTEFGRLAAIVLAISFFLIGVARIRRSNRDFATRYALPNGMGTESPVQKHGGTAADSPPSWIASRIAAVKSILGGVWARAGDEKAAEEAAVLWEEYQRLGRLRYRAARFGVLSLCFIAFGLSLFLLFDWPTAPYRGWIAEWTDRILFTGGCVSLVVLTFFVLDATSLCEAFVRRLAKTRVAWPLQARLDASEPLGLPPEDVHDLITIEAIGYRTEPIGRLVTYPFVVLLFLLISRNAYFDSWTWPTALVLSFTILGIFVMIPAFTVRRSAERARSAVLERIRERQSRAIRNATDTGRALAEQLEMLAGRVERSQFGAFAPWRRHPTIRALLIPFGGIGALTLLQLVGIFGL